ncbi:MAG: type II secretion system GspH family protein [Planctomycetaceae bacterium]|nr:type II secretion system GspH family protein [Planctomycetaceae bacterium]
MNRYSSNKRSMRCNRGFTLVEMLVSVTLVLLMMTMFASVFQIATSSVSQQQANSENDQKARVLMNVIRADFEKRSYRDLQPYTGPWATTGINPTLGESSLTSPTSFGNRSGYLYISTNNADNYSDDMIQLTIDADQTSQNTDETEIFGRASALVDPITGNASLSGSPNQPELDDGQLSQNSTTSSTKAEICYFLRNGNLYRRKVLIREPLSVAGGDLDDQPTSFADNPFFVGYTDDTSESSRASTFTGNFRLPGTSVYNTDGTFSTANDVLTNDYHLYFDHSAIAQFTVLDSSAPNTAYQTARIIGVNALSNENFNDGGPLVSLGKPRNRFGFDFATGFSREHLRLSDTTDATSTAVGFIGRFLHAETSANNFNYPQQLCNVEGSPGTVLYGGNPYDVGTSSYTLNANGVISEFDGLVGRGGSRAQEDLILSNVHEFKVEVLDERFGDFVVPGHGAYSGGTATGVDGDFHIARLLNTTYGPDNRPRGAVFDTWHPDNSLQAGLPPTGGPFTAQAGQRAPYELYEFTPPLATDGGIMRDGVPIATSNKGYWQTGSAYVVGDVVFGLTDTVWDPDPSDSTNPLTPINGVFDTHAQSQDQPAPWEYQIAFRCIGLNDGTAGIGNGNGTNETGAIQPTWAITPGRRTTDGEYVWEAVDNTRSLKAIRITVRFQNEKSGDMRQLTMVLPVEEEN